MKTIGHLEQLELTLTALGPVFVGCGKKYGKKEYIFLPGRSSTVLLPKETDFFPYLVEHGLVDKYESYMLGAGTSSLREFLKMDCRMSDEQIRQLCPYALSAEEALDANHSLKEISTFIRDAYGQVYVPGSSLKGALRTILLFETVLEEQRDRPLSAKNFPEWQYFHTLRLNPKRNEDAVNSILRGILVSDSEPIDDSAMMLAGKSDFSVEGREKKINLCRECIRPGTKIRFRLTLDNSVLKGRITTESIRRAIERFDEYYLDHYLCRFTSPYNMPDIDFSQVLFLGGGAGYFSKTVSYPYCGQLGLSEVCRQMQGKFRNHYHHLDEEKGISPHTMKYALYHGLYYLYGLCKVEMQ